jgi:hypothetical protein
MTSGSLFSADGMGWSGVPDTIAPDAASSAGNDSAVFRLRTKRSDFRNVRVDVDVRVNSWSDARPGYEWPEVVLWLRYASEFNVYWASMLRADGKVDIEKKVACTQLPDGCAEGYADNEGQYYILPPSYTSDGWPVELGVWYHLTVAVRNGPGGSVAIATFRDGQLMSEALDVGVGQEVQNAADGAFTANPTPPIAGEAKLGIRADDADFNVAHYVVTPLR